MLQRPYISSTALRRAVTVRRETESSLSLEELATIEQMQIDAIPFHEAKRLRLLSIILEVTYKVTYYAIFFFIGATISGLVAWFVVPIVILVSASAFFVHLRFKDKFEYSCARCKQEPLPTDEFKQ